MDKFVTCARCERTINVEENNHVKYEEETLNLSFTLYFCLGCVDKLIEQSKMLEGENE
ncbi:TPA: hypothetical protein KNH77_003742 [Clostridioides difficile]|nr:hypothetical protein [Clostridioides difficile]EJA6329130.1 hypothetical protein [Clostridioides difficile]EJA6354484.1 hypothetical protein [Clostridioides difficile]EJX2602779.1 hypothetical protein [Clostridioides difficile]EJX2706982.1 hypothetical protein [Clostridioides difficile]EJX2710925.1 hypothetical protein [Clostridioides difficile]